MKKNQSNAGTGVMFNAGKCLDPEALKETIISLIRDNLIHTKLLNGLSALGLHADDYSVHLSQTIFNLMDFEDTPETDRIFEYYLTLIDRINKIDFIKQPQLLDQLARSIYRKVLTAKRKIRNNNSL